MKKSLFCKNEIVNKVFNDLKKIKTKKLKDGIIVLTDIGFYALDKNYFSPKPNITDLNIKDGKERTWFYLGTDLNSVFYNNKTDGVFEYRIVNEMLKIKRRKNFILLR